MWWVIILLIKIHILWFTCLLYSKEYTQCMWFTNHSAQLEMILFLDAKFFNVVWTFSWAIHTSLFSSFFIQFCAKEHQNYFGIDENLGPVAVSIRREKVEDPKEKEGSQFNYRIVFRTSEVNIISVILQRRADVELRVLVVC